MRMIRLRRFGHQHQASRRAQVSPWNEVLLETFLTAKTVDVISSGVMLARLGLRPRTD
jgi:hypothetical protein